MGIQDSIISYIRSGIVSGEFNPGARLKGREYFCEKFSTTPITVQRAFNRLIKLGFVTAEKSVGTFVAEKPTCLYQVALLFTSSPDSSNWTSFSQVVVDNIPQIEKQANVIIKCFFGMGKSEDNPEVFEEFQQYLDNRTLAASIFLSELRNFRQKAWENVNIPYYVVSQPSHAAGHPRIELVKKDYYNMAVAKFRELGRRRIAIVTVDLFIQEREEMVKQIFKEHGLKYYEQYVQSFIVNQLLKSDKSFWIDRFLRLLFSLPIGQRPDGIFVTDDNFLDMTFKGLTKMGLRIGTDIDVIGHANFPVAKKSFPNVYQLGYCVPSMITSACEALLSGESYKDIMVIPEFRKDK